MSKLEATWIVLRLISEVPSRLRQLEGAEERTTERLPLLVRKFVDDVAVSIRYEVTVNTIVSDFPRFLGNEAHAQTVDTRLSLAPVGTTRLMQCMCRMCVACVVMHTFWWNYELTRAIQWTNTYPIYLWWVKVLLGHSIAISMKELPHPPQSIVHPLMEVLGGQLLWYIAKCLLQCL